MYGRLTGQTGQMADQDAQSPVGCEPPALSVLRWDEPPEGPVLVLLDQTRLPAEEVELVCTDVPALVRAIRTLAVRGAPLLGIAGGYGVALAAARGFDVAEAADLLEGARPTAVNLGYGARRVAAAYWEAAGKGEGTRRPQRRRWPRRRRCTGRTPGPAGVWRSTARCCSRSCCRAAPTGC